MPRPRRQTVFAVLALAAGAALVLFEWRSPAPLSGESLFWMGVAVVAVLLAMVQLFSRR